MPLEDYLRYFERVADWNGWTHQEKALQLSMCLRGAAKQVLTEVHPMKEGDYDYLVELLVRQFDYSERQQMYRAEFRRQSRKAGEVPMEFSMALRRMALKAYPDIATSAREQCILQQFLQGLGGKKIRKHVSLGRPITVEDAVVLATEFGPFEETEISANEAGIRKLLFSSS